MDLIQRTEKAFSLTACTEAILNKLVTNVPYLVDYKGKKRLIASLIEDLQGFKRTSRTLP